MINTQLADLNIKNLELNNNTPEPLWTCIAANFTGNKQMGKPQILESLKKDKIRFVPGSSTKEEIESFSF